ncbi:hypothetical protein CSB67_3471 [Enterobacter hormaechei]|nr:hypothetical protein CSB67_3471 [Enterobacter hormaechei]
MVLVGTKEFLTTAFNTPLSVSGPKKFRHYDFLLPVSS